MARTVLFSLDRDSGVRSGPLNTIFAAEIKSQVDESAPGLQKKVDLHRKSLLHGDMTTKTIALSLGLLLAAGSLFAESPFLGDWNLDEAHSKIAPGMAKNTHVQYHDLFGGRIKCETNGVDANGHKTDVEWKGKFDGKDYAVKGDAESDMRSYTMVDSHTLTLVEKKAGKVIYTGKIVVAPDGKTRTVTVTGRTAKGKKFKSVSFYHKD